MYWKPSVTVANKASWNVLDRLSIGSDEAKELKFARFVVKNLVLPQQWESVRYGVVIGSVSPRQMCAISSVVVPVR